MRLSVEDGHFGSVYDANGVELEYVVSADTRTGLVRHLVNGKHVTMRHPAPLVYKPADPSKGSRPAQGKVKTVEAMPGESWEVPPEVWEPKEDGKVQKKQEPLTIPPLTAKMIEEVKAVNAYNNDNFILGTLIKRMESDKIAERSSPDFSRVTNKLTELSKLEVSLGPLAADLKPLPGFQAVVIAREPPPMFITTCFYRGMEIELDIEVSEETRQRAMASIADYLAVPNNVFRGEK